MSLRFATILLIIAVLTLAIIIGAIEFVGPGLFGPDGRNLVKNGSFESGHPTNDENIIGGPNIAPLCDGSTSIDAWVASGIGRTGGGTCSGGRKRDVIGWLANPHECPPNVPPCNSLHIGAQDGDDFIDLTGNEGRPPSEYGKLSQAVSTDIGKTYELSFFIGSSSSFPGVGLGVRVEIPGVEIPGGTNGFFSAPPPQSGASNWSNPNDPPHFRFRAVSETTTLNFTGAISVGGKGSDYIGLDNVSLQKVCFIVIAVLFGCP
jgi:hypothetical protein